MSRAHVDLTGKQVGNYQVQERLGKGATATVYRAVQTGTRKEVALKVLHDDLKSDGTFLKRFHREGRISAQLNHPTILRVHDISDPDAALQYIVTDLIVGINFEQYLATNPIPCPEVAIVLLLPVLKGLGALHANGIVHRDIKPENLMVDWIRKTVMITDLGIAQPLDASRLSIMGTLVGSLAYMAPERLRDVSWDHRVDIWAFGTMLYQAACRQFPFAAQTRNEMVRVILGAKCTPPASVNAMISPQLDAIIRRCLEPKPEKRYADVAEIRRDLEAELRVAGIDNPEEELFSILVNPKENSQLLFKEVGQALLIAGKHKLMRGSSPEATVFWSRVLAYHPDDMSLLHIDPEDPRTVKDRLMLKEAGEFVQADFEFLQPQATETPHSLVERWRTLPLTNQIAIISSLATVALCVLLYLLLR